MWSALQGCSLLYLWHILERWTTLSRALGPPPLTFASHLHYPNATTCTTCFEGKKKKLKRSLACETQKTFITVSNVEHWVIRCRGLHFEWQHCMSFIELLGNRKRGKDKACQAMILLASFSLLPTWWRGSDSVHWGSRESKVCWSDFSSSSFQWPASVWQLRIKVRKDSCSDEFVSHQAGHSLWELVGKAFGSCQSNIQPVKLRYVNKRWSSTESGLTPPFVIYVVLLKPDNRQ